MLPGGPITWGTKTTPNPKAKDSRECTVCVTPAGAANLGSQQKHNRGPCVTHAQNALNSSLFSTVPRLLLEILVVDGKSRRYAMVPAFGMVTLPQDPSTGNGQLPGWAL